MKYLTKVLITFIISIMVISIFLECDNSVCYTSMISISRVSEGQPVNVAVLLYRADDLYISLVTKGLEEIQKNNPDKVQFTFYDAKNDQSIQNKSIDTLIQSGKVDLFLLNLVDPRSAETPINKIKGRNIPVVLFNREPLNMDSVRSYPKAYFVGTNASEAGMLQGKILINQWTNNKNIMDRNQDDILEYVMLIGDRNNIEAIGRTKFSILTINGAGIQTQEIASRVCNWDESTAKTITERLYLQNGNKIEAIISNNDAMAIGAIEALQEYGYNLGDKSKTIPVVGVDAIPEAQELIKKGFMTGSVFQDPSAMAEATYSIGMNLVFGRAPLEGTTYKFDETGVSIRLPYAEYTADNR